MDRTSVRVFCCPQCSAALLDTPYDRLDCSGCSLSYPLRDGVPVLLIGEATRRPTPTDAEFERLIGEASRAPFHGWDLSWLDGRRTITLDGAADPMRAKMLVARAGAILDIERLEPLGVQVVWTDENCHNSRGPQPGNRWPQRRLPFGDNAFGFRTRMNTNLIESQKP